MITLITLILDYTDFWSILPLTSCFLPSMALSRAQWDCRGLDTEHSDVAGARERAAPQSPVRRLRRMRPKTINNEE
jgi:hypothetical protein